MSFSTIISIAIVVIIIIVALKLLSGLLRLAIGVALLCIAAYWVYHIFFLHGVPAIFK